MAQRISFKVEGMVQGVNFRYFTMKQAQGLGVTGFVQNNPDGTVSGEAQGEAAKIKDFIDQLHRGPRAAQVSKVDQKDIGAKDGESGFSTD